MTIPDETAPQRWRKRPVEVDAMQWVGNNAEAIRQHMTDTFYELDPEDAVDDPDCTAAFRVAANGNRELAIVTGEWIIRDARGCYPCKPEIFAATYERVDISGRRT